MISNWVRPNGSELDTVWRHFTAGTCESFHIRVLSSKWEEDCMDILQGYFFADPLLTALGLQQEQQSLDSLRAWVRIYLKQNITYGCFLQRENDEEFLVAVDVLYVRHIRDELPIPDITKGEAFMNYIKFIKVVERHIHYPECKRHCNYLTSFGVIIRPNYRKRDIEKNMIELRESVARRLCINVIGAAFIGQEIHYKIGKSKEKPLSEICKYVLLKEFTEEKLLRECGLDLSAAKVFPIKIMRRRLKLEVTKDAPLEQNALVVVNLLSEEESSESEVDSPESAVDSPESAVDSPESAVDSPESAVDSPESAVESPESEVESSEPEEESSKPEVESSEPEVESSEPEVESSKPEVESSKPEVESSEPEVESSKLEVESGEPEVESSKSEVESSKSEVESPEAEMAVLAPEDAPLEPEVEPLKSKAAQLMSEPRGPGNALLLPKIATLEPVMEPPKPEVDPPEPEMALLAPKMMSLEYEEAILASKVMPVIPEVALLSPQIANREPELALHETVDGHCESEVALLAPEDGYFESEVALLAPEDGYFESEVALPVPEDGHFEPAAKKIKCCSFTKRFAPK